MKPTRSLRERAWGSSTTVTAPHVHCHGTGGRVRVRVGGRVRVRVGGRVRVGTKGQRMSTLGWGEGEGEGEGRVEPNHGHGTQAA